MFWRLLLLPLVSLFALLPLMPLPAKPATIIGMSRQPPLRSRTEPLLSRLLARSLLARLADTPEDAARVRQAQAAPALASLNSTASPLLTLCPAPDCADVDLLVLTLLHKRAGGGPAHDPHRGVVEQWTRPAAHYLRPTAEPSPAAAVAAAAARDGIGAALGALSEQVRAALHPQLLSDPADWRLLWRQQLPGPAGLLAGSVDGRRLAVSYRRLDGEAVAVSIRHYAQLAQTRRRGSQKRREGGVQRGSSKAAEAATAAAASGSAAGGGTSHVAIPATASAGAELSAAMTMTFEDIPLEGNLPVSALALAGEACVVYSRLHDARLFRVVCRHHGGGSSPQEIALRDAPGAGGA